MDDRRTIANTYFQASLVAERMGHWVLSRNYAQQAKALYEELNDERNVGRLMKNLGGLNLLLGKPEQAVDHLKASFASPSRRGRSRTRRRRSAASPRCICTSASTTRRTSTHARRSSCCKGGRTSSHEIGQSNIVLGRALLERGRLEEAEECFTSCGRRIRAARSVSHRAGAWVALGDLARSSWGRPRGSALVPQRRRGASRHPLLRRRTQVKARLFSTIAVTLALLAGACAPWAAAYLASDGH